MTLASFNVNIQMALPQGWTKEEVEERITDLLVQAFAEGSHLVEFDITSLMVNADPFPFAAAKNPFEGTLTLQPNQWVPPLMGKRY